MVTEPTERDVAAFATFFWEAWEEAGPDGPGLAGAGSAMNTDEHLARRAWEPRGIRCLAELVSTVRVEVIAIVSGLAIIVLVVLGALQRTVYPLLAAANLDAEKSAGTWFSAALLWTAAAGWLLVAVTARPRR